MLCFFTSTEDGVREHNKFLEVVVVSLLNTW